MPAISEDEEEPKPVTNYEEERVKWQAIKLVYIEALRKAEDVKEAGDDDDDTPKLGANEHGSWSTPAATNEASGNEQGWGSTTNSKGSGWETTTGDKETKVCRFLSLCSVFSE